MLVCNLPVSVLWLPCLILQSIGFSLSRSTPAQTINQRWKEAELFVDHITRKVTNLKPKVKENLDWLAGLTNLICQANYLI